MKARKIEPFKFLSDLFMVEFRPRDLEEQFRIESLTRDKTLITIVMFLSLTITLGFLGLDIVLLRNNEVYSIWIPSRIVASIVSLIAIWAVRRQSSPKLVDLITFVWGLVIILHMFVINLTRQDYIPVIVWDILVLSGIYFILPMPLRYKISAAFLLTGSSVVIWVINRIYFTDSYQTISVLVAYVITNVYGIFVSVRHERSRRQQYLFLMEATNLGGDLSDRTKELEKTLEELRLLAMTDPLTGVSNRRHFMDQLAEELERKRRYGVPFSLMMIDIDNLKEINDTYGHEAGDEVLRSFAKHCLTGLRFVDRFARFGGDEFIALLVQTGQDKGKEIAERLTATIEALNIQTEKETIHITVSIGLTATENASTVEELIKRADEALYKAKNGGRNQVATL